jgi:hypothetical protein
LQPSSCIPEHFHVPVVAASSLPLLFAAVVVWIAPYC